MTRAIRISVAECFGVFETALSEYIGPVAFIANHQPLFEAMLELYLVEASDDKRAEVLECLEWYQLPSEVREQALDTLLLNLGGLIQRAFGLIHPGRHYRFDFEDEETAVVYEELPKPYVPPIIEIDEADTWTGDYIPERLRRRLGES